MWKGAGGRVQEPVRSVVKKCRGLHLNGDVLAEVSANGLLLSLKKLRQRFKEKKDKHSPGDVDEVPKTLITVLQVISAKGGHQ